MDQREAGGGGASPPKRKNSRGRNRNQNSALEQQAANEGGNPNVEEIDSEDERIESLRQQLDENDKKHGARIVGLENQLESLNTCAGLDMYRQLYMYSNYTCIVAYTCIVWSLKGFQLYMHK